MCRRRSNWILGGICGVECQHETELRRARFPGCKLRLAEFAPNVLFTDVDVDCHAGAAVARLAFLACFPRFYPACALSQLPVSDSYSSFIKVADIRLLWHCIKNSIFFPGPFTSSQNFHEHPWTVHCRQRLLCTLVFTLPAIHTFSVAVQQDTSTKHLHQRPRCAIPKKNPRIKSIAMRSKILVRLPRIVPHRSTSALQVVPLASMTLAAALVVGNF
jgi:hypothetical protein